LANLLRKFFSEPFPPWSRSAGHQTGKNSFPPHPLFLFARPHCLSRGRAAVFKVSVLVSLNPTRVFGFFNSLILCFVDFIFHLVYNYNRCEIKNTIYPIHFNGILSKGICQIIFQNSISLKI